MQTEESRFNDTVGEATVLSLCQIECLPDIALEIKRDSKNDRILSKAFHYTTIGWPKRVENDLKPYQNHRDELCIEGGCLMLGVCVAVLLKLQRKVLEELYQDHPGIVRIKSLARSYY